VVSLWKAGFHPGPVVTIPWRARFHPGPDHTHSGGKPPHCMRWRDCARRFRLREAFGVRPLAGAVKERHHGRRPTVPRLSFRPVLQPTPFAAHPTTLPIRGPSSTPARGWVDPHRRQGPEDRKAPPAELLAPVATEVPVAGSPPKPVRWVGRFPSTGSNPPFEQPSTCARFVPASTAGNVEGSGVLCGGSYCKRSKSEMRRMIAATENRVAVFRRPARLAH
jgi:hypothetical protein